MKVVFHSFILYLFCISEILPSEAFNPYYLRKEKDSGCRTPVHQNEFPFIVSLYVHHLKKDLHAKCLGIILNTITVLTAATCLFDRWGNVKLSPRTYVVLYGLRKGCDMYEQFEPRLIRYVVHHPDFFAFTRRADLAFMISFKPLLIYNATEILPEAGSPSKDEPSSDKLFVSFEKVPVGTKCTFIGFLTENDTGMPLTRLTATSIEIENESLCEEAYTEKRKALYPDKYCAGIPSKGDVPTWQDAGGPLICGSKVVGIASRTSEFGTHPGIFTSLHEYKSFVKYAYDYAYLVSLLKTNSASKLTGFVSASLRFHRIFKFIFCVISELFST